VPETLGDSAAEVAVAGQVNLLFGDPESGKTLVAAASTA
jgi:predicted ATPase with chaperone activity